MFVKRGPDISKVYKKRARIPMFERVMGPEYQICILKGWGQNSNVNILNELATES